MKKYLVKFMPFWSSEVIGIISKICLTYTTIIMGLFGGLAGIIYGGSILLQLLPYITKIFDSSKTSLIIELIFHGFFYILLGFAYIYHYVYARKGFNLKNHKYIRKSYLMFGIAWFMYEYTRYGLSLTTLIDGVIVIAIFIIPLIKAEKAFKNNLIGSYVHEKK